MKEQSRLEAQEGESNIWQEAAGQMFVRAEGLEDALHTTEAQLATLRAALDGLFDYFYHMGMQDHPWYHRAADALDDTAAAAQAHDERVQAEGYRAGIEAAAALCDVPMDARRNSHD